MEMDTHIVHMLVIVLMLLISTVNPQSADRDPNRTPKDPPTPGTGSVGETTGPPVTDTKAGVSGAMEPSGNGSAVNLNGTTTVFPPVQHLNGSDVSNTSTLDWNTGTTVGPFVELANTTAVVNASTPDAGTKLNSTGSTPSVFASAPSTVSTTAENSTDSMESNSTIYTTEPVSNTSDNTSVPTLEVTSIGTTEGDDSNSTTVEVFTVTISTLNTSTTGGGHTESPEVTGTTDGGSEVTGTNPSQTTTQEGTSSGAASTSAVPPRTESPHPSSTKSPSTAHPPVPSFTPTRSPPTPTVDRNTGDKGKSTRIALGICIPILIVCVLGLAIFFIRKKLKKGRGYITLDDFGQFEGMQNPNYDADL